MTRNRNHLSPPIFPHAWASEWGQDTYGIWQAFTYKHIRHAFRWMMPGRFMMGSPEDEEGRFDQEDLHSVTLSKGFWLGETTVTQALWQAVMDEESPSHFKGDERPVEQVSWDDCQRFIKTLNAIHKDFNFSLPSEAQWEYACRAGTETAFYFGGKEDLTRDRVNYSGEWDKSNFEGETKAVKSYYPNPWGLYEMHGNVWEWCQDVWKGNLGRGKAVDPLAWFSVNSIANEIQAVEHVIRGGAWRGRGWQCRSAYRLRRESVYRHDNLGFRLSLGHELKGADAPGLRGAPHR